MKNIISVQIGYKVRLIAPLVLACTCVWSLMCFLGKALPAQASSAYYVDGSTGQDLPGCGNINFPCRTIGFALMTVTSGDVINVAQGVYEWQSHVYPPLVQRETLGPSTRIVFASVRDGNSEIYVMNTDGTGQTNLTNNITGDFNPASSPDGTRIAFNSDRDGNSEIYVMNADGTEQTRLTNNPAIDAGPVWSPDGTKIAFHSDRDGNGEVYVMNADGTGIIRITEISGDDIYPAWSPDGTKMVFYSNRDGNREIYVMNADGTDQTRLTNNSSQDSSPAWSPDGALIGFTSDRDGNRQIYVMNTDGTGQTRLTNNSSVDTEVAWSPDGTKIAFVSDRDGNSEIYVMNANGTDQIRLTNNTSQDYSPDMFKIDTSTSTLVTPEDGGELTSTANLSTTITFPPNAVTEPVTVTLDITSNHPISSSFGFVGHNFYINAITSDGTPVISFTEPFTITIQYSDSDIEELDEASLVLNYWDTETSSWVEIPTIVDIDENKITVVLDHLTDFAVIGETQERIFLPLVLLNH